MKGEDALVTTLLAVWHWIREHVEAVSVAAIALLLGFIAWGAWRRQVNSLRDAIAVEKARARVAALEARREAHEARDAELEREENELTEALHAARRQAVAVREEVEGKSNEEIAARFNSLYR